MGYKNTPVEAETTSNKDDPNKTETVLTGGEAIVEVKQQPPEVEADVTSDSDNPEKTVATLTNIDKSTFTVTVEGEEFAGTAQAKAGTELKFALMDMVKEDGPSYGSFKYRDEEDNPVAISTNVESDLKLKAIRRGE